MRLLSSKGRHLVGVDISATSVKLVDIQRQQGRFHLKCYGIEGFSDLKEEPYTPQKNKKLRADKNIFTQIRKGDVLLHHPY